MDANTLYEQKIVTALGQQLLAILKYEVELELANEQIKTLTLEREQRKATSKETPKNQDGH